MNGVEMPTGHGAAVAAVAAVAAPAAATEQDPDTGNNKGNIFLEKSIMDGQSYNPI
jgi:hypothetical protein